MQFRTIFVVNRIVAPICFAVVVATFLLPSSPATSVLYAAALIPFVVCCIWGAVLGLRLQRHLYLEMRCPFCGRIGIAVRGVTWVVGWSLTCESCGIVRPSGILGVTFTRQEIHDNAA